MKLFMQLAAWTHCMAELLNPCSSELSVSVRGGCHRTIGRQVLNKKQPIKSDILKQLCILYGGESCSLLNIRICCMCLISFVGFLRFSELVNLKRSR